MENFGFIITRHVNSEKTNEYWNHCVKLLNLFYPFKTIVIIDDNSDYKYVKYNDDYKNIKLIQSEFPKRGELLPYYYLLKYKFFENAVIIHDSVFFHKRLNFENLNGIKVIPLWHFNSDKENIGNTLRIIKCLSLNKKIEDLLIGIESIMGISSNKWIGFFGAQVYINLKFLIDIERKYKITNMLQTINCRADRCCFERIIGCIFSIEYSLSSQKSLLGDIMTYHKFGYTYDEYINTLNKNKKVARNIIKVWTGR